MTQQKPKSKLIGRRVEIKGGYYAGHWGIVQDFDGDSYTVSGGSIGEGLAPLFSRDEFRVARERKDDGGNRTTHKR